MTSTDPRDDLTAIATAADLRDAWPLLSAEERHPAFDQLPRTEREDFFISLSAREQARMLLEFPPHRRRVWMRLLAPDDAVDLIQEAPPEDREGLLELLDDFTRKEIRALLAYAEDEAGGLMNPRYARVRADMTADEAISYLRRQTREHAETVQYVYVTAPDRRLMGVLSFRDLFAALPGTPVRDIMNTDLVTVGETDDQESVSRLFAEYNLAAIPVVDGEGRMKGIVTLDDIVDVVQEEATEDIQKYGGMEALDAPYLDTGFFSMIKKRAGWLAALFVGETFTASAMGRFEEEIARAVVLALFIPLIISSGGNSGSQASTLVVRAMALGEIRLRDWFRVVRREIASGLTLGMILAVVGFVLIVIWQNLFQTYGEHYMLVALVVAVSLVGVVMFGTVIGSLLPFVMRRMGFDPASASAPLVATLVDVTGLVIYFTAAAVILGGTLL